MKLSYAIPVHDEHVELDRLLTLLVKRKRAADEIMIQCDAGNTTDEVYSVLDRHAEHIMVTEFALNKDFASFKNNLKSVCTGDWIFQIDADEYPDPYLIDTLPYIINANPGVDVYWVPRINTVQGLTTEHAQVWGWQMTDNRVNFPDYQCRVLRNAPEIQWRNRVHEVLTGHRQETRLPINDEYCLHHPKTIERQITQNKFYDTI